MLHEAFELLAQLGSSLPDTYDEYQSLVVKISDDLAVLLSSHLGIVVERGTILEDQDYNISVLYIFPDDVGVGDVYKAIAFLQQYSCKTHNNSVTYDGSGWLYIDFPETGCRGDAYPRTAKRK